MHLARVSQAPHAWGDTKDERSGGRGWGPFATPMQQGTLPRLEVCCVS